MSKETESHDLISRQEAIDAMYALCDEAGSVEDNPLAENPHIDTIIWKIEELEPAQSEALSLDYQICANAMLKMWIDKVVTRGEYNRIMDRLNAVWRRENE